MRPGGRIALRRRGPGQGGFTLIELLVSMVVMGIVTAMLVGIWIALTNSSAFAQSQDTAASSASYALDRVSAELRDAQPPSATSTTPFIFTQASPNVCDGYDCTFYSAYNNPLTSSNSGATGVDELLPTSIWLDSSGNLWWVRDTNNDGSFDTGDKTILLARNVVNTASGINRPIFTYVFRSAGGTYSTGTSLTAATCPTLVAINIEIIVDTNLNGNGAMAPTYVDYVSTVCPQN